MAFLQRFGKGQAHSPPYAPGKGLTPFLCVAFGRAWREAAVRRMPSKIFCMAGGRTGAQTSGFRVRMDFLQRFGKSQAHSPPYAPGRGSPPFVRIAFGGAWREAAVRHNAFRDFLHGERPHKSTVQQLLCAYSLLAGLRQDADQFLPHASRGLPAAYRGEAQKNTVSRQFRDTAF